MARKSAARAELYVPLVIVLLAAVIYWPALRVFFSLDDLRFLLRASGLDGSPMGLKRILSVGLYFEIAWRLFGANPWPYHLAVIVLHAANAWLVYKLARRLSLTTTAAFASSVLFLVTPVAFLPAHWISGIQEVSMTFFALCAALSFIREGRAAAVLCIVSAILSILCKEASLLLLPGLALVLPGERRRRWMMGAAGLLAAIIFLALAGGISTRPQGHPYETAYGVNILWNLLTYLGWSVKLWDYFPDRLPEFQKSLATLGLVLPALLALYAWKAKGSRGPILRASVLFLVLLAPVLPLTRHTYIYYLYLPLVPIWLLAGSLIGKIRSPVAVTAVLLLAAGHSFLAGQMRRNSEMSEGVLEEPVLRYAEIAREGVESFGGAGGPGMGDVLFLMPLGGDVVDLERSSYAATGEDRVRSTFLEQAILGGEALKLFFPGLQSVSIEKGFDPDEDWKTKHIYWTYGRADMKYYGYGIEGRFQVAMRALRSQRLERAKQEAELLLGIEPDNPTILFVLGRIAVDRGDMAAFEGYIGRLQSLSEVEAGPGEATEALRELLEMRP
jgi:hypothetical protein